MTDEAKVCGNLLAEIERLRAENKRLRKAMQTAAAQCENGLSHAWIGVTLRSALRISVV